MSTTHSTWPVLLIPYNLPPWLCMKQQSFILSSVIPGEKALGNDIDVYLQPLIHELKLLWKGVDAYDAFSKQQFKLRASLMWTVNDFPAYANLSGWSTKGRVACPEEGPPTPLTGSDIFEQLSGASFIYGKSDNSSNKSNKRTRDGVGCSTNAHDEANAESSAFEDIENFVEEETGEHLYCDDTKDGGNYSREVMQELRPPKKNGRPCGYGVGVTKSQVTKFSAARQSKQIEKQSRKMKTMEENMENMTRFFGKLESALPEFFATRTSNTQLFSSSRESPPHLGTGTSQLI
ncbi:tetratricopeptide-like helical domain, DYW domain protein [Tanacetum coccineum]